MNPHVQRVQNMYGKGGRESKMPGYGQLSNRKRLINLNKKRTEIICIEIYIVLLLAKLVTFYAFIVFRMFGPKIQLCKNFDKFHVFGHQLVNKCRKNGKRKTFSLLINIIKNINTC